MPTLCEHPDGSVRWWTLAKAFADIPDSVPHATDVVSHSEKPDEAVDDEQDYPQYGE